MSRYDPHRPDCLYTSLPTNVIHASGGRTLDLAVKSPVNRRSLHEEDRHLNAAPLGQLCNRKLNDLDRRPRRRDLRPGRPLTAGARPNGISPNRAFRSSPEPKLRNEAALTGGPRYSASANNGLPHSREGSAA